MNNVGEYLERSRPQYKKYSVSDFISVKSLGAKGDGKTDDAHTIQSIINQYAGCKIIYFPARVYLVFSTFTVPA